ncbi:conjugal transfer nickase/helicase domain-containing protein [Pantoea ananatis]|uniref:conjugal transfer nickase/helicase domain-containing protein n=2 Tax=Pantoea ananas TaxID=553 RepID=UPI000D6ADB0A|nr:TraI domain-containing protein [Pantoea ananatis]PWK09826.1 integrating conjugative element relaxase (TIGR03760 family) [Pantoea ananatis]
MERVMKWLTGRGNNRHSGLPAGKVVREVAFRPVLEGSTLMQTEERRRHVRMLADNSPLSQSVTGAWWLMPAQTMLERVQDCPAAWSGAYSSPGGFGDLSLGVAVRAVRLVRGMMLPPGATPEEQSAQAPGWVCAVFWAGLFHHLPWLTQVEGATQSGKIWYPGLHTPDGPWRVRPAKTARAPALTGQYMAAKLLPETGMLWLHQWPEASRCLLQFLSGERAGAGVLYSIIMQAREGEGLETGGLSDITGASSVNPATEMQHADNAPNLAHIAPVLLSSNIVSANVSEPIENKESTYTPPQAAGEETAPGKEIPDLQVLSSALQSALGGREATEYGSDGDNEKEDSEIKQGVDLLSVLDLMAKGEAPVLSAVQTAESTKQEQTEDGKPVGDSEPSEGNVFLDWLRESVEAGKVTVNESDSLLHVLSGFIFMISPDVFFRFISSRPDNKYEKNKLQKNFESLGLHHIRNGKGLYSYHKYDSPDKRGQFTKLSGYMIKSDIILKKGRCLSDSIWLSPKRE